MCRIEPVTYKIYEKKMWEKREGAHESVRNWQSNSRNDEKEE
jgi:hypothetical protein